MTDGSQRIERSSLVRGSLYSRRRLATDPGTFAPGAEPIRSELFSVERLEQHAESLAEAQRVVAVGAAAATGPHVARLNENAEVLAAAHAAIVKSMRAQQPLTPAAEWLLDNYHVIDEQVREIKDDLPPGFYRKLPKLADGPLAGYPRVFGAAWALIAHTDSAFDLLKLRRFIIAYQHVQPFTIGELWAVAITLRIVLVENLRRIADAVVERLQQTSAADALVEHYLAEEGTSAALTATGLRELDHAAWSPAFAVRLAQRLRDRDPVTSPALRWLNDRLAADRTTADDVVQQDMQRQGATNVTVRNIITSMRLISTIDWAEWFESVSPVDAALRAGSNFGDLDFATRDMYRRAIENLATQSGYDEVEVAQTAIEMAVGAKAATPGGPPREPGYFLIAKGRPDIEQHLGCRVPLVSRLYRAYSGAGVLGYVLAVALLTALLLAVALAVIGHSGLAAGWVAALLITAVLPASDVAVAIVNRVLTQSIDARMLPGLELRDGILPELRTMIVVPALLTNSQTIAEAIDRLEVHHLSNVDANLHFALLSDWVDWPAETAPDDDRLLAQAAEGIARLNALYGPAEAGDRFFLLHRRRLWNPCEGKWMGWERKRGKLHELNRLLRGATDTSFVAIGGKAVAPPEGVRYVITLDADTRTPINAAKRLIGKMAHPLCHPVFDAERGLVIDGHAILQPRVTPSLPVGREGSLFQRAFSGPNGLDPYAFAVSDVYQDLFEEGSYVGKGIYDIDVFESTLKGRIPENAVLSHDLLEGIFTRAGLATDVEVVEEFPSRYDVAAARQYRWTRGDWQLLPWIFGRGPGALAGGTSDQIPSIGRWKLIDNLRRSLLAPSTLLAFIIGWLLPFDSALNWTAMLLLAVIIPSLLPVIAGIVPRRPGVPIRHHLWSVGSDLSLALLQASFIVVFLAHQAWLMVDAVVRTLYRQFVSRKKLLEWTTAAQAQESLRLDSRSLWVQVGASALFATAVGGLLAVAGHGTGPIAAPFAALWVLSPIIAWRASLPPPAAGHLAVADTDAIALRLMARRTWRYFETFITAEDNMLPPDNFQEDPVPVVARRTSPTNIGLYLLSALAARDFGWQNTSDTAARLEATFETLNKLERFRGHFYNWYDTQDLRTLDPKYISSVDSGNLAGHLIALGNACRAMAAEPVLAPRWLDGLEDTRLLIVESLQVGQRGSRPKELLAALDQFGARLRRPQATAAEIWTCLRDLGRIADSIVAQSLSVSLPTEDAAIWADALKRTVTAHERDLAALMPWAEFAAGAAGSQAMAGVAGRLGSRLPALAQLPALCADAGAAVRPDDADATPLREALHRSARAAESLHGRLIGLAEAARAMAEAMEFGFLYNPDRQLLSIGYRAADGSLDTSYYDLLASEARLASLIAIAKGDIPARHWFRLGRTLAPLPGGAGLISWSGSMFEYLMPSLVMRAPTGSILEQTNRLIVRRQIEYADSLGVPWGMSESEFNARDIEKTYQYSGFGVPGLGYKRGLAENIVVAPYATGLAAMVDPAAAVRNFRRMAQMGARGHYGWYEALDFTPSRLPKGSTFAVVKAYMAHHQAMALVAVANTLHDGAMRERFHAEPIIQSAELLLQERMPRDVALARLPSAQASEPTVAAEGPGPETQRRFSGPHSAHPRTQLLSNGRYAVMLTAAGSGYSRWRDVAITRWREDTTRDGWGAYLYLRDIRNGAVWTAGHHPMGIEAGSYRVVFSEDHAEIARRDGSLSTLLEITVSPEDDCEVRRISITNLGTREREIEVTSYAELALARQADDIAHPAFAKMFVQTEFEPALGAIIATRKRRSQGDPQVWAAHLSVVEGEVLGDVQFETDRAQFLGRGQTARTAAAVRDGWPLSNTVGPVLDPIFSLRRRVKIQRGGTARIAFWTLAGSTREEVLDLADRHHDAMAFERAATMAWTQAQVQLHHLDISSADANLYQRLAAHVIYPSAVLRPARDVIKSGLRMISTLWAQGISGDLPIVLVLVSEEEHLPLVRQLLRAHEYWRLKQLAVDLVILNERQASYQQELHNGIEALVRTNRSLPRQGGGSEARGAVHVLRADLVPKDNGELLLAVARTVLRGGRGTLAEQLNKARDTKLPPVIPARRLAAAIDVESALPRPATEFFNGFGGFAADGREYQTSLQGTDCTPAPWINVIANASFGFQVSTDGSGYTWADNSQSNQITPWSNDPVGDAPGEVIYIADGDTGEIWTPTALPIREKEARYVATHGPGYSRFEHTGHGVALELVQFVAVDDPIKISRLRITNQSVRVRRLAVTAYVEWVLGQSRTVTSPYIVTEIDTTTGALLAHNRVNQDHGGKIAFMDLRGRQAGWTGDRTEFIGRDGSLDHPLALLQAAPLSKRVGAGLDPCGALQTHITLGPVGTAEIVLFLGQADGAEVVRGLVEKYRAADLTAVFAAVTRQWDDFTGTVATKTPDRSLDILLNTWLPYQTLACRVWARCGFYQASGAYGFRDQLQDVMALCVARPDLTRAQILRAAARQFLEGDVQHWWLPDTGRGVRTRISDDRAWLAYVTAHYVQTTGDSAILAEAIPYISGPLLAANEHDAFFQPEPTARLGSLLEHCAAAIDRSLETGPHSLPLMGTGDWNDGMDRVGAGGQGESVWLGWFLYATIDAFAPLAEERGEQARVETWRAYQASLKRALEESGWDGDWYRRAYFDDGSPLGSVSNIECRIDSIAQSWAVISGAADPSRAERAMRAVDKYLVRRDDLLSLLFTPPFENALPDPGYIKGYPPGIRENGGQYTHAATWAAYAFALLGDGDRAHEIMSMLNPIHHTSSPAGVHRYKTEPYVIAADIYSVAPHTGRGGWTWYTGSAGWAYRVALEFILGFKLRGDALLIDPCIPRGWPRYEMTYRHGATRYHIVVENPFGVCRGVLAVQLDDRKLAGKPALIPLSDDRGEHRVQIVLGFGQ